ncbi:hypothetical protein D3C87_1614000 [compost metagenome]
MPAIGVGRVKAVLVHVADIHMARAQLDLALRVDAQLHAGRGPAQARAFAAASGKAGLGGVRVEDGNGVDVLALAIGHANTRAKERARFGVETGRQGLRAGENAAHAGKVLALESRGQLGQHGGRREYRVQRAAA